MGLKYLINNNQHSASSIPLLLSINKENQGKEEVNCQQHLSSCLLTRVSPVVFLLGFLSRIFHQKLVNVMVVLLGKHSRNILVLLHW